MEYFNLFKKTYYTHNMIYYKFYEFKKCDFLLYKKANPKVDDSVNQYYLNSIITLDTETSHNHNEENPCGWIYLWAINFNEETLYGKSVMELMDFLKSMNEFYKLDGLEKKAVIYIHNSSYDLAYIMDFLRKTFFTYNDSILALKSRNFITYEIGGFCFKCSYKLCNKSLNKWSEDLGTTHKKLIGNLDYDKIYYPWDILENEVMQYMENDTVVLYECLIKQFSINCDTLATTPLTITGYPRRDMRVSYKQDKTNYYRFKSSTISLIMYNLLLEEFAGGYTHGNRFLKGLKLTGEIYHFDFASHYPSCIMTQKFPIGKWYNRFHENMKIEEILNDEINASIVKIIIRNVRIKKGVTMPFMSKDKVVSGLHEFYKDEKTGKSSLIVDNGRVLKFNGYSTLTVNEIDLKILSEQYEFNYVITECYKSFKDYLPKWVKDVIIKYFEIKTVYKQKLNNYKEGSEEYEKIALELLVAKQKLNSIYGMFASKIIRDIVDCDKLGEWTEYPNSDPEKTLFDYYNSRNNFCRFEWGCWTTSYARKLLYDFINLIEYKNCIYCDTDSIFFFGNEKILNKIYNRNEETRKEAIELDAYIKDLNNDIVNFNSFDSETHKNNITRKKEMEVIKEFKFLHSKCYALRRKNDDSVSITIAGVTSKSRDYLDDGITREMELFGITSEKDQTGNLIFKLGEKSSYDKDELLLLGDIDNLKDGFTFNKCGGTRMLYSKNHIPTINKINGHELYHAGFGIILPVTKTINDKENILYDGEY